MYPGDRYYTVDHEWVMQIDNGTRYRIGITHFAQESLGDLVYVELPQLEQEFEAGDVLATLESVKAVADVFAPMKCRVVALNEEVIDDPSKINSDPYDEGWLVEVESLGDLDFSVFLTAEKYEELVKEEE